MIAAVLKPVSVAALAAALTGCLFSDTVETFGGPTMGSTYSVKYVRGSGMPDAEQVQPEVERILADIDRQMSTYRSDSDIERFNEAPGGTCMAMPEPVLTLVRAGDRLSQLSEGSFDLTLEPLLNLWGFGPKARAEKVPSAEELAAVREQFGYQHLSIQGDQLCKDAPVQVDFNSIAAGYAVDRITERLQSLGLTSYLVEATGELKAVGKKPDGSPWRIAIEAPQSGERVAQKILALDGYGVSSSGDYRNYFEENGRRYSHTLDPQTGAPISHKLAAVTVVHAETLQADGLSTLLMVLGPERGYAFAEREGIAAFFVTREGDGFVTRSTSAFDALFAAQGETP